MQQKRMTRMFVWTQDGLTELTVTTRLKSKATVIDKEPDRLISWIKEATQTHNERIAIRSNSTKLNQPFDSFTDKFMLGLYVYI